MNKETYNFKNQGTTKKKRTRELTTLKIKVKTNQRTYNFKNQGNNETKKKIQGTYNFKKQGNNATTKNNEYGNVQR